MLTTLQVIQAVRRLYKPTHKKLPLPAVVELNRRLVTGYTHYKDDPRIIKLRASVTEYNRQLRLLGLRDHQVEYAKFSIIKVIITLIYRTAKLIVLGLGALPGFILFLPVFMATKIISIRKAKEALKGSTVKIQGRDVIATWKLLVALAFAPVCYNFYVVLFCWWTAKHRFYGLMPDWMPTIGVAIVGWILFPAITFAALRFGEIGMDIAKSLRPLILSLNPTSANTLVKLRERRAQLSDDVTKLINDLGPELFPDFEAGRIVADPFTRNDGSTPVITFQRRDSEVSSDGEHPQTDGGPVRHNIPQSESFANLGSIGLFASRPVSRARSRSNSGGFPIKALSGMGGISTQAGFDTVAKKIADAMKERRRRKVVPEEDRDWEDDPVSVGGSGDEDDKKNI
jgi:glycerol-3-phosphate O-acyltransferase/dihydroxyacetone phosphate acyltransferase